MAPGLNLLNPTVQTSRNGYIKNTAFRQQMNQNVHVPTTIAKTPNTFSMSNIYSNPFKQCGGCGK